MEALWTKEGNALTGTPWEDYPRPRLRRGDWLCLNGPWELRSAAGTQSVRVPFSPESLLSGVKAPPRPGEEFTCSRSIMLPDSWAGRRVLLHFGAVSRRAEVRVNGTLVCTHENGYLPFSADVTDALRPGENRLEVTVTNDLDDRWPWGKQTLRRGGMWYTPCSGIWQTVWAEPVPREYVRDVTVTTGPDWAELR